MFWRVFEKDLYTIMKSFPVLTNFYRLLINSILIRIIILDYGKKGTFYIFFLAQGYPSNAVKSAYLKLASFFSFFFLKFFYYTQKLF